MGALDEDVPAEQEKAKGHKRPMPNKKKALSHRPPVKKAQKFDVGKEEKELLNLAKNIRGKLSASDWKDIAQPSLKNSYKVIENDTLWGISKKLLELVFITQKYGPSTPILETPTKLNREWF